MYGDLSEAAYYLSYALPASLCSLLKVDSPKRLYRNVRGSGLLRIGFKGKSLTIAKRVRALANF